MKTLAEAEETLPAFPNWVPYNHLLLEGLLVAKTRSWKWGHRGLVLLYDSSRTARTVAEAYGLSPNAFPRGVLVGAGTLVDVRLLTDSEKVKLVRQFNPKVSRQKAIDLVENGVGWAEDTYVMPNDYGYFFEGLRRFRQPVVFKPPKGAVSVFRVPVDLVAAELGKVNFWSWVI